MVRTAENHQILILATGFLTLWGLLMIYSASAATSVAESSRTLVRQAVCAAGGYCLMLRLMFVDYHVWQRRNLLVPLSVFILGSLVFVFVLPPVNGAHRWLRYGAFSVQPSEIAKLVVIIAVASFLGGYAAHARSARTRLLLCLAFAGTFVGLIGAEPDLGQALCVFCIVALMLFVAGLGWQFIAGATLVSIPAFYLLVWRVPYRRARVIALFDPSRNPLDAGWHALQAKIAVGSGGIFGVGFGNGLQKPPFLPEASTDFIYAVIGEELGLVGAGLIIAAFLLVFSCAIRIALRASDSYGFYLAFGIAAMLAMQALINILMVIALLPTKGMALPFVSRGGSSLLLNLAATGILLNISISGPARRRT